MIFFNQPIIDMDIVSPELIVLAASAAAIGFFHTMLGPDHYLPFVMMSRAGNWSQAKTVVVTICCGLGHIFGSILLGMVGVAMGIAVAQLEQVESVRGTIAAWALIAFGLCYFVWGVRKAAGKHIHKGTPHSIEKSDVSYTPWVLFTVFVLGPFEPLIPLLMYPAAKESLTALLLVTGIFGIVTIVTMLAMVALLSRGVNILPIGKLERYTHALAGATICFCGVAIQFFGV